MSMIGAIGLAPHGLRLPDQPVVYRRFLDASGPCEVTHIRAEGCRSEPRLRLSSHVDKSGIVNVG